MAERSLNKVMILGRLGRDPEVKYLPSGQAVANFSVATSEQWTGKDGNQQEKTEWHRVVFFGKLAEIAGQYLGKGKQVYIEGRIETRSWEQDGQKRYMTEIVGREMIMLGGRGGSGGGDSGPPPQAYNGPEQGQAPPDDDIPF